MPIPAGPDPSGSGAGSAYLTPSVDVYPFDGTTFASLQVLPPSPGLPFTAGVATAATVTVEIEGVPTLVQRWTCPPIPTGGLAGWWVLNWTVINTGAGEPEQRVFVPPAPQSGGPTWTPTREKVAAYVPSRPLMPTADGRNIDLATFDDSTRPSGSQVDAYITSAVNWVLLATGVLDETLADAAGDCAAWYAAACVELGYPERNDPMKSTANTTSSLLFKQAEQMLARLVERNAALTGYDGDDPQGVFEIVPVWSFPTPTPYGDQLIF